MKKKNPIRLQIMQYLEKNRSASSEILSSYLGVTRADITYHLRILHHQKIIEFDALHSGRPGRPQLMYILTDQFRLNNYRNLCSTLLSLYIEKSDDPSKEFERVGSSLFEENKLTGSDTKGLNHFVHLLSQFGYQPSWIAHKHGPQIIFKACPYHQLVLKHPGLCMMDQAMISAALKQKFNQVDKLDLFAEKQGACRFEVLLD